MPVTIPENFNGGIFAQKFGFSSDPEMQSGQFWLSPDDATQLVCPSLPDLTEEDIADCVTDLELEARVIDRLSDSKNLASSVPGYATWTPDEALAWFDANLSDEKIDTFPIPKEIKEFMKAQNAAIKGLGRMSIAYRNKLWPELPE